MTRAGRLWLIIPWALFTLIAAAWSGYWFFAADKAKGAIAAWAAAERQSGAEVEYGALRAHGFPALLRIEIPAFAYAPAARGWRLETARIDAHVNLVNPNQFGAVAEAPLTLRRGAARTDISARALIVSLRMNDERLTRVSLQAQELFIDDPAQEGRLSFAGLLINARPDERAAGDWQIAFDAADLHLARPARGFGALGQDIAQLRALAVVETAGALWGGEAGVSIERWREGGAHVRFEALDIAWGAAHATGAGVAGLDEMRRLDGALSLSLTRPADALAALSQDASVPADVKGDLNSLGAGLALLGQNAPLAVRARDGALMIENTHLRDLPPLY